MVYYGSFANLLSKPSVSCILLCCKNISVLQIFLSVLHSKLCHFNSVPCLFDLLYEQHACGPHWLWTSVPCKWKKEWVLCLVCDEQVQLDWQCGFFWILTSVLEALSLLNHKDIYLIYSYWHWLAFRREQWHLVLRPL